jgi:hypothetical protein
LASSVSRIVDVGHTVDVARAISACGVPEYEFNLRLGQYMKQALVDTGLGKTILRGQKKLRVRE